MGWVVHLVLYYVGVAWTYFVFVKTAPENSEGNGAMYGVFAVLWPLTWLIVVFSWIGMMVVGS